MRLSKLLVIGVCALTCNSVLAATVLMSGNAVEIEQTLPDPTDLWVDATALKKVNGFELKPEGACLDEICVPIQQDRDSDIYIKRQGKAWVNVTELADRIRQPHVADAEANVFSFGAIPAQRQGFVRDGLAPDFTLQDWRGETYSLSDFKGKKIMLLTWASW